jgi:hypothetical protein
MQTILRGIRIMAMTIWVGGIIFFINVAQVAFTSLPTTHLAGIIVRNSLIRLHSIAFYCAIAFLIATLGQIYKRHRERHLVRSYSLSLIFILVMTVCTLYSATIVIPHMEHDRQLVMQNVPGAVDIDSAPTNNPQRLDFNSLHHQSTMLEEIVLFFGIGVLALIAREPHLTAQNWYGSNR